MRPSPPSRPRSSGSRSRSPTRSSSRIALYASRRGGRAGAGAVKANRAQIEKALKAPGRDPLLPPPRPRRIRAAARWPRRSARRWAPRRSGSTSPAPSSRPIRRGSPTRRRRSRCSAARAGSWSSRPATRCVPALEALLEAPAAGNPVVAGRRRAQAGLEAAQARARRARRRWPSPATSPDAREADRLALDLARGQGLHRPARRRPADRRELRRQPRADRAGARQVRALCRRLARQRPSRSTMTWSTRSAPAADEGDLSPAGRQRRAAATRPALEAELARLRAEGQEGITLLRAMLRRMALLARLRAEVEQGQQPVRRHGVSRQVVVLQGERRASSGSLRRWRGDLHRQGDDPARRRRAAGQGLGRGRPGRRRRRIVRDLPPGGAAALEAPESSDRLAREALADHVELVEARIGEADRAALGAVLDRDLEAQQVAQLPLERGDVGGGCPYIRAAAAARLRGLPARASFSASRTDRPRRTISSASAFRIAGA